MRCSRKSTTWRGSAALLASLAAAATLGAGPAPAAAGARAQTDAAIPDALVAAVTRAIETAVRARVGADAQVEVMDLQLHARFDDASGVAAVLAPETRGGERTRVAVKRLRGRSRAIQVGEVFCTLQVRVPGYRVHEVVARGATVSPTAVRPELLALSGVRLQAPARDPAGARAVRDLAPGDAVFARDVVMPPAIRSGDTVRAAFASGAVLVDLDVVATQNGEVGEEIRLVNPSSGRALRGRIVAPGRVEVGHER